jgi:hypothetical protein
MSAPSQDDPLQKLINPHKTFPRFRPIKTLKIAAYLFAQRIRCFGALSLGLTIGVVLFFYLNPSMRDSLSFKANLISFSFKGILGFAFILAAPWVLLAVLNPQDFDAKKSTPKTLEASWAVTKSWLMDRRIWGVTATCAFWVFVIFLSLLHQKEAINNDVHTTITRSNERLPNGLIQEVIEKKKITAHEKKVTRSTRIVRRQDGVLQGNSFNTTHSDVTEEKTTGFVAITAIILFLWIRLTPLFGALSDRRTWPLHLSWHLSYDSFWRLLGGQVTWIASTLFGKFVLNIALSNLPTGLQHVFGPTFLLGFISMSVVWFTIYLGLTYRFLLETRPAIAQQYPQYTMETPSQTPAPQPAVKKIAPKKSPAKRPSPKPKQPPQS